MMQETEKLLKSWHMGTHLTVLSESFPLNTNMTGFRWFSKNLATKCALDESSYSIGIVKLTTVFLKLVGDILYQYG